PDSRRAQKAAALELIERDRILRSWYGGPSPQATSLPHSIPLGELPRHYRIETYRFPKADSEIEVGAVFGFPTHPEAPFFCGFGASHSLEEALRHAFREGLQRMAFLWGEPVSGDEPVP